MRWLHINDPITETVFGARASVVDLIRIQHDHLPGSACLYCPSIVKDLYAVVGQANGIGVVTMFRICLAGKPRTQQLYATDWPCGRDPVSARPPARSFKTFTA
jgi:hypothetical protein